MWTNKPPEKDGYYWFKGDVKGHDDNWQNIEEVIVKMIDGTIYFPGSITGFFITETNALWKEVNKKASEKTEEALSIAESLLRVAFDKFEEKTGFIITDIEIITHSNSNGPHKSMIVGIGFGKGNISIQPKRWKE